MEADSGDHPLSVPALAARSERHGFVLQHLTPKPVCGLGGIRLFQAHSASRLNRRADAGKAPPYWAYAWGGGLALARYVTDYGVRGHRLLDCGAGSGLVGIIAARAGATVIANDVDPYALAAAECNAALNGTALQTLAGDLLDGDPPDIDCILAGDIFYDATLARRALRFFERCRAAGIEILIGDPGRRHLPCRSLHRLAVYDVMDMGGIPVQAGVYRLRPEGQPEGVVCIEP